MIALSHSRMKDMGCPFRFNALHVAKTHKEPRGEAAEIGSHVAEILATYRLYCLQKQISSDISWLANVAADKVPDPDKTAKILGHIDTFTNTNLINVPVNPAWSRTEAKLAFDKNLKPLPEDDGWFDKRAAFRMVADFAYIQDNTLWIVDDKTGQGDTDPFQVRLYAYLLPKLRPHNQVPSYERICCVMNELGKRRCDVVGDYAPGEVEDVGQDLLAKLQEVNSWTEYPATVCSQCKWCSVPGCPVRGQVETALVEVSKPPVTAIPTEITTRDQAERAMQFVLFAESCADAVKDLLRAWVEANGEVYTMGKVAEMRPNSPWKATDVQKVAKALVAFGVQPEALWKELGLSESALEKLCKKHKLADRLPLLLAMGERKEYKPRFGFYNDKL
jgi:hypothetical protein